MRLFPGSLAEDEDNVSTALFLVGTCLAWISCHFTGLIRVLPSRGPCTCEPLLHPDHQMCSIKMCFWGRRALGFWQGEGHGVLHLISTSYFKRFTLGFIQVPLTKHPQVLMCCLQFQVLWHDHEPNIKVLLCFPKPVSDCGQIRDKQEVNENKKLNISNALKTIQIIKHRMRCKEPGIGTVSCSKGALDGDQRP